MFLWDYFIRLGTGRLIHNQKLVFKFKKIKCSCYKRHKTQTILCYTLNPKIPNSESAYYYFKLGQKRRQPKAKYLCNDYQTEFAV